MLWTPHTMSAYLLYELYYMRIRKGETWKKKSTVHARNLHNQKPKV
jgi:hypothetical protein